MAAVTNAQILAAITTLASRVDALEAKPITNAPAKGEAKSPAFGNRTFREYVDARIAAKVACTIHDGAECNRTFSPKSSGREQHVARLI